MGQPFVNPPERELVPWAHCSRCCQAYDARTGHACDPLGFSSGVLVLVAALVVAALLFIAGVRWWPFG